VPAANAPALEQLCVSRHLESQRWIEVWFVGQAFSCAKQNYLATYMPLSINASVQFLRVILLRVGHNRINA
jgi:hypothetical protein